MGRLSDVDTHDIADAIRLGCRTMCSVFNSDDDNTPFFGSQVLPEPRRSFSSAHSEAHVPGRHLNALLRAEDAMGVDVCEECIAAHERAAFLSYSGPIPLPLNRDRPGGGLRHFLPHNIREGFHALAALAQYRSSVRAGLLIERSVAAIEELWCPETGWGRDHIEGTLGLEMLDTGFITGIARAIGPLVKAWRATGSRSALELAVRLKDTAVERYFTAEGSYVRETFGTHPHSVTCVLSSLAQLAEGTSDAALMDRVRAFYENGLRDLRDEIGWSPESTADGANPDRGEANNTGDIVETALILGRWGYPRYLEDAERILRCHLLPSQLRDISFIPHSPEDAEEDGLRAVAQRHRGAFGFPAPYGHLPLGMESIGFNMDIVGGVIGSLLEAYRSVVHVDETGVRVDLLFDHGCSAVAIESPYTHECMRVCARRPGPIRVRLPFWVDYGQVATEGAESSIDGQYLVIPAPRVGVWVDVRFPLRERRMTLRAGSRFRAGSRGIDVVVHGDEVVAMDNQGADLTFFAPLWSDHSGRANRQST